MITGLRWYEGKRLVSNVRGSDYAHAGEEEAIIKCLSPFDKNPQRLILDVGCGQGGTAQFIQNEGWGKVTGVDIEAESIEYAQHTYREVSFIVSDVVDMDKALTGQKFDLICLFNSFYAFPNQLEALKKIHAIAKKNTKLMIFDYTDLTKNGDNPMIIKDNPRKAFLPIRLDTIFDITQQLGWACTKIEVLNKEYELWYEHLLALLSQRKEEIIKNFGEQGYAKALSRYSRLYEAIKNKLIGGCIVYAEYVENA